MSDGMRTALRRTPWWALAISGSAGLAGFTLRVASNHPHPHPVFLGLGVFFVVLAVSLVVTAFGRSVLGE